MITYIAFYKGRKVLVEASTAYSAQCVAAMLLKAKKYYDVTVMRADVEHNTASM